MSSRLQTCEVHPFHGLYAPLEDVPVIQAVTAYNDEDGRSHLLVINEALYFGNSLPDSLLNPNQIQMSGIPVCNNPFDTNR